MVRLNDPHDPIDHGAFCPSRSPFDHVVSFHIAEDWTHRILPSIMGLPIALEEDLILDTDQVFNQRPCMGI
jgi:hypothetical protein